MPNEKNKQLVQDLKDKLSKAKTVIFADYLGLSADKINELRSKMKENDTEVSVAKNTLVKIALKDNNLEDKSLEEDLKGPTATFFGYGDPISPIKALVEFAKDYELPKIKSALVDGVYTNASQVEVLSTLPSKEELLAKVVGGLKSPISGIVNTFGGVQRKFVYAINAIKDKKSE